MDPLISLLAKNLVSQCTVYPDSIMSLSDIEIILKNSIVNINAKIASKESIKRV